MCICLFISWAAFSIKGLLLLLYVRSWIKTGYVVCLCNTSVCQVCVEWRVYVPSRNILFWYEDVSLVEFMYLVGLFIACQVEIIVGDSGLCCCGAYVQRHVWRQLFERKYFPVFVDSMTHSVVYDAFHVVYDAFHCVWSEMFVRNEVEWPGKADTR